MGEFARVRESMCVSVKVGVVDGVGASVVSNVASTGAC